MIETVVFITRADGNAKQFSLPFIPNVGERVDITNDETDTQRTYLVLERDFTICIGEDGKETTHYATLILIPHPDHTI